MNGDTVTYICTLADFTIIDPDVIRCVNLSPQHAGAGYTNTEMKEAIAQRKPLVTTAGPRSLIFRGAITGVDTSKEGLQFYEVVPVALVVAGTQMATGHRTMDTRLYFEGELIDAATNKPVIKVVRQGEGKDLNNESTPMAFENIKQVIDDMATDATMFDVNKISGCASGLWQIAAVIAAIPTE